MKRLKSKNVCTPRCTLPKWRLPLARLRAMSGREACGILAAHGFTQVRRWDSHIIMQKLEGERTISAPAPELRIGTRQSIIRQSELSRLPFEQSSG